MPEETRAAVRAMEMVERKDRVLIVEDEDNARKGYEQLLQRWGCDVVGVGTAEEALAKFALTMEKVCVDTVEAGYMTKDLALLVGADQRWLSTTGFLDKVAENLTKAVA